MHIYDLLIIPDLLGLVSYHYAEYGAIFTNKTYYSGPEASSGAKN